MRHWAAVSLPSDGTKALPFPSRPAPEATGPSSGARRAKVHIAHGGMDSWIVRPRLRKGWMSTYLFAIFACLYTHLRRGRGACVMSLRTRDGAKRRGPHSRRNSRKKTAGATCAANHVIPRLPFATRRKASPFSLADGSKCGQWPRTEARGHGVIAMNPLNPQPP